MSDFYKMFKENEEDTLMHYGVKGMKWGKHKSLADYLSGRQSSNGANGSFDPSKPRSRERDNEGRMFTARYGKYEDPHLRERIDLRNRSMAEREAGKRVSGSKLQRSINEGEYRVRLAGKKAGSAINSAANSVSRGVREVSKVYNAAENLQVGGVSAKDVKKSVSSAVSKAATKSYSAIKSAYNSNECKSIRNRLGNLANKGLNKAKKGITSLFD